MFGGLQVGGEFMPKLRQPRNRLRFYRIQNQHHKHLVGYFPFTLYSVAFLVLPECLIVHIADDCDITSTLLELRPPPKPPYAER
jgi:hypothetical protein